MPMCRNSKEVSESRRQKAIELLLGYEFEERRFLVIEGAPKGRDELHDGLKLCRPGGR